MAARAEATRVEQETAAAAAAAIARAEAARVKAATAAQAEAARVEKEMAAARDLGDNHDAAKHVWIRFEISKG